MTDKPKPRSPLEDLIQTIIDRRIELERNRHHEPDPSEQHPFGDLVTETSCTRSDADPPKNCGLPVGMRA